MLHERYHDIYGPYFFARADGVENWDNGQLKYGDALAAVCYAWGVPSFEKIQEIYGFQGNGRQVDERTGRQQLQLLIPHCSRSPQYVLEIGAGRGEVSYAMALLGALQVQAVEPQCMAPTFFDNTPRQVFEESEISGVRLIRKTCPECLEDLDLRYLDTFLMVETLEHIPEPCFTPVWEAVKEALIRNKGLFVCVNWLDYHPLRAENEEHCRLTNDDLYAKLSEGGTVKYQKGSHLVVQF